jgi:ABC-type glycerol-3-phosphate transport system substrate-binding protein
LKKRHLLLLCLLLLSALSLVACGSSESDEDQIVSAVETAATSSDPADCEELTTLTFMEQTQKEKGEEAVKACEDEADSPDNPESVEVSKVEVDGSEATADVAFSGGDFDGQTLVMGFVDEDGWKVNEIVSFADFDRDEVTDELFTGLGEGGLTKAQLSCVEKEVEAASDGEVEEFILSPTLGSLVGVVEGCE